MKIIKETAYSKSDVIHKFINFNELRMDYLIMVYLYPYNAAVEHWLTEICSWCKNSYRVKPNNRLLSAKTLYDLLWLRPKDGYSEQRIGKFVQYLVKEKQLPETTYNYRDLIRYLESFFLWLSNKLSQEDLVNPAVIKKYIKGLIDIYR